ncbi:MAG TPA: hypothetical protein VEY67_12810 [Candidatus Dormibacteraeota bacterium]|nr:hypothetical protein [Candidatus Dormibacteraeota bacterium]
MPSLRVVGRTDPWWDLDGKGARRTRLRQRVVAALAFGLAVASCGTAAAMWIRLLGPAVLARLG